MLHNVEIFCIRHTFDMTSTSRLMRCTVRIRESKLSCLESCRWVYWWVYWVYLTLTLTTLMKAHLKWCNSKTCCQTYLLHEKTGRVHLCTVRLGSTLYSRQAAAFVSAYLCVCWCLKRQSILLKSTHSCLTMRQSSNVLVNKNHTHLHPHPLPLWYYLSLFSLSALKP